MVIWKIGLRGLSDKCLQLVTKFLPSHLPKRMNEFRDLYEHHLVIRIENQDVDQVDGFLKDYFSHQASGNYFNVVMKKGKAFYIVLRWRCSYSLP